MRGGFWVSNAESDALEGLPHAHRLVYLAIRRRMDVRTCLTGARDGAAICWRGLAEILWEDPHPGYMAHKYVVEQVRRYVKRLIGIGLLENRTQGKRLIFFLPVASLEQSVSNKVDRKQTDQVDRKQTGNFINDFNALDVVIGGEADMCKGAEADTHKVSGKDNTVLTHMSSLTDERKVFLHWCNAMGKQRAKFDKKRFAAVNRMRKAGFGVEDLCLAVDGCAADAWHMGRNKQGKAYNDLSLICRDAEHVERFMTYAGKAHAGDAERAAFLAGDGSVEGSGADVIEGVFCRD